MVVRLLKSCCTSVRQQTTEASFKIDLPQVDLMNFRVEFVRPRSVRFLRESDEGAGGRLVSLEGFSFSFRAKNEEWRDLQLVSD